MNRAHCYFFGYFIVFGAALLLFSGCSSHYKKRQQQRDRVAESSGLFCEFVSGDEFTDVDVEINIRMAKRCDLDKPWQFNSYKNASDNFGIVYCCQMDKSVGSKSEKNKLSEKGSANQGRSGATSTTSSQPPPPSPL